MVVVEVSCTRRGLRIAANGVVGGEGGRYLRRTVDDGSFDG